MNKNFYSIKDSSITYFFCLVAMLGASVVLSLIAVIVSMSTNAVLEDVLHYEWLTYINMFLSGFIFLVVFMGINLKYKKNYVQASRLKTKFNYVIALVSVLLGVVVFLGGLNITGLYNHAFTHIFPLQSPSDAVNTNNFWLFLVQVIFLGVLPAAFEELVFRGIIYNGLRQKYSAGASIVISAVLFMLIHASIYKTFYQLILGLILGVLVYYTGSIIYGMIFHFTNNFIIILLNYISPNDSVFELVKRGELATSVWGVREILLAILFFLIASAVVILILYLLKKYTSKHKRYLNLETTNKPLSLQSENLLEGEEVSKNKSSNKNNNNNPLNEQKNTMAPKQFNFWLICGVIGYVLLFLMSSCGVS